jgi:hypothetical protein
VCVTVCQLALHARVDARVPVGVGRLGAASAIREFAEVVPLGVVNEGFNVRVVAAHPQVDARHLAARCLRECLIAEVCLEPVNHSLESCPAWGAVGSCIPDFRDVVIPLEARRVCERTAINVHNIGHSVLPSHEERWAPLLSAQVHVWKRPLSFSLSARRVHEIQRLCQPVSTCIPAPARPAQGERQQGQYRTAAAHAANRA